MGPKANKQKLLKTLDGYYILAQKSIIFAIILYLFLLLYPVAVLADPLLPSLLAVSPGQNLADLLSAGTFPIFAVFIAFIVLKSVLFVMFARGELKPYIAFGLMLPATVVTSAIGIAICYTELFYIIPFIALFLYIMARGPVKRLQTYFRENYQKNISFYFFAALVTLIFFLSTYLYIYGHEEMVYRSFPIFFLFFKFPYVLINIMINIIWVSHLEENIIGKMYELVMGKRGNEEKSKDFIVGCLGANLYTFFLVGVFGTLLELLRI